ncbi:Modification methylase PaeR7I [Actinomadura rubteroloni]|uniref:site-specific DNA-methyltransferase (adenine-specific) n=1 Tax=Actinomadura rubteroloni TaxID=1926885 RepID=A0A2P4UNJ4_9ACTN|nr:BREX-2 system adenine-specific DNA-methyltransferase PglX [Actinomadura rubteroloni]POM26621.1 Modification methylase PaeR7I [Actinomadura rubteroloni]
MIDRKSLLGDLKKQVRAAEGDLHGQVDALSETKERLKTEHTEAFRLGRTAATFSSWLGERITQVAVAWVLGTVFVRFCEDNELIPEPYLTAPDQARHDIAQARYESYVETAENPTYRGWLKLAFAELGQGQPGRLLFDREHNPLYQIPLSHDAARKLVEFWRRRRDDGTLIHDFIDQLSTDKKSGWDTRFLGDLYQDLSESARETFALLQTPEFVEEFILDRTLNPALEEFGYENIKIIDPTCGSGHFVLGTFSRLVKLWAENPRGKDPYAQVRAALESVHGVDINPFAVAIARFRLFVAAMAAAKFRSLAEAAQYEWPIQLAVGDSLIKRRQLELTLISAETGDLIAEHSYSTEDIQDFPELLKEGRYHVVVGNPPYPTVKDRKLNEYYRQAYNACAGTYALSVPFAQRFFELAKRGEPDDTGYGMVGQITANSFMKREFGKKLVEEFFAAKVELVEVIDMSGAYVPGHGTPTVILIGRTRAGAARSGTVRTVRSVQAEPTTPKEPSEGRVWSSIRRHVDDPGFVNEWISVDDLERARYFGQQPWVLLDGGLELLESIQKNASNQLASIAIRVGLYGDTHADDAFRFSRRHLAVRAAEDSAIRPIGVGDEVRDYVLSADGWVIHPYDDERSIAPVFRMPNIGRMLWPNRTELGNRATGSRGNYFSKGKAWWSWHQLSRDEDAHCWSINFAFVATHTHFVLVRSPMAFTRTAPMIKLPANCGEKEHLSLLGPLNSSTACFWLKQVSHCKGSEGYQSGIKTERWEYFYEFTGTKLLNFPLPLGQSLGLAKLIDRLGHGLLACAPSTLTKDQVPENSALREAQVRWNLIRARMISLQEELDWQVYSLYKLLPEDLRAAEDDVPELALGERAFEIVLARRVAAGEASDEWFRRHGSTPITEIPERWPEGYRRVVQKRIDAIESSQAIGMIERSEYKRRWATEGWDSLQEKALRGWLLDRMEAREHWFDDGLPVVRTLSQLADMLSRDDEFVSVSRIFAPRDELRDVVGKLISGEHVPFIAALRYKPSGLKKRADWEHVWDLQRREDAAADEIAKRRIRDATPVPPKYTSADFLRPSFWRARGKLDVPKERFISYGEINVATPSLYGWAGWDHKEQAQALAAHIADQDLSSEEIRPYLAGLLELQPWIEQWHDAFDDLYGGSPAAFFAGYRTQTQSEHGLTDDDLRSWRPPAARGRRAKR